MSNKTDYTRNNEIHAEAIEAWSKNNYKGTVEAVTGIGKTWVGLKAMHAYSIHLGRKVLVLFLAERLNREGTLIHEIDKFKSVTGIDIYKHIIIQFNTYQSAYKERDSSYDLIIADRILFA